MSVVVAQKNTTTGLRGGYAGVGLALLLAACSAPVESEDFSTSFELGRSQQAIVGGDLDEATQGVVGLALDVGGERAAGHCSGTLIAPNLVLTARHCIALTAEEGDGGIVECERTHFRDPLPATSILVSPEAVRPRTADASSYVRGKEVRTVGAQEEVCGFDLALVVLERSILDVPPIAPRLWEAPRQRETFSTVGFGLTDPGDPNSDGTRQRASGSQVRCSRAECVELSQGAIRDSEWASVNAPICSGDSGGPALDEKGRVFGVASRGDLDCKIAVYGDVTSFGAFIADTAIEAAELGEYPAPSWALTRPENADLPLEQTQYSARPAPEPTEVSESCSLGSRPSQPLPTTWLGLLVVGSLSWLRRHRVR